MESSRVRAFIKKAIEPAKPIKIEKHHVEMARDFIASAENRWVDSMDRLAEDCFDFYEMIAFMFNIEAQVYNEDEAYIQVVKPILTIYRVLAAILLPIYFANSSKWPFLDGEEIDECYETIAFMNSVEPWALSQNFLELLKHLYGEEHRSFFKKIINDEGVEPAAFTELVQVAMIFFTLIPCESSFKDEE